MEFDNFKDLARRSYLLQWRRHRAILIQVFFLIAAIALSSSLAANAQTYTATDIGGAATGTYTSASGTYTIGGGGTGVGGSQGIGGTSDSFRFVYTAVTGNFEMIANVASQTNTSSYATAGLMMRGSTYYYAPLSPLDPTVGMAYLSVSPKNGVNFMYRPQDGTPAMTVLGPSIGTPKYLRLVRSQNSLAGYQSADGVSWVLVGTYNYAAAPFQNSDAGFAVSSNANPTLSTAVFNTVNFINPVPQRSANMLAWYRADSGVIYNSGTSKVSQWQDQSGNANHASQSTSGNQPTLSTASINNLPAINFAGASSQYLTLPAGFANFTSGAQVFVVIAPTSTQPAVPAKIVDIGNGTASDNLFMQMKTNTTGGYGSYNNTTSSEIVTTAASIGTSFQLIEGILDNAGNGTVRLNGTSNVTGTLQNLRNLTRSNNYIGGCSAGGCYLSGKIAEILIYNTSLSTSDRHDVESYCGSKYGITIVLSQKPDDENALKIAEWPKIATRRHYPLEIAQGTSPPVITPGTGLYASSQSLTMTAGVGASIYYTLDGTTPTSSSTLYTAAINVGSTTQVKAVAYVSGVPSTVTSALIGVDATTTPLTRTGLMLWLRSDLGITSTGGSPDSISKWLDLSGTVNDGTQNTTANQPQLIQNAINGWPGINTVVAGRTLTYLNLPSGFANLTPGVSLFTVTSPSGTGPMLDVGNGAASNNFTLGNNTTATTETVTSYNGGTASSVSATSALTLNQYQLLGAIQNGSGTGTIYVNALQTATGTLSNPTNISRTINHLASNNNGSAFYTGSFAELLLYNRALSITEQAAVNSYLLQRYQLNTVAVPPPPPVISVPTSTLSAPAAIAVASQTGSVIYATTDGTTPTTSSPVYTAPINVTFTQTVKAIAVRNGLQSTVSSATYTLDSTAYPAPGAGGPALQLQIQLPTNAIQ